MKSLKDKKGLIIISGIAVVILLIAFTGWTKWRFTDITLCLTCHELFVTNEDYQPVRENKYIKPKVGLFKVGVGCAECHMYPYEEYKKSAHFDNEKGIKPGCVGCHEPHNFVQILRWKFLYANTGGYGDTPFHILSNSLRDLPEWEGIRKELAEVVREGMVKENSFRCKECHNPEITDSKLRQDKLLKVKQHNKEIEKGATDWNGLNCIDCHYNLVHASVPWQEREK